MALSRDGKHGVGVVEFGGWAITQQLYNLIRMMLPDGSVILEYRQVSPNNHPQQVLEDCQLLFEGR